jgi:hypothetical protein
LPLYIGWYPAPLHLIPVPEDDLIIGDGVGLDGASAHERSPTIGGIASTITDWIENGLLEQLDAIDVIWADPALAATGRVTLVARTRLIPVDHHLYLHL